jgi:hypothetical protein
MPSLAKRIRLRFGISAPRMTVRTHLAWHWRWLGLAVVVSLSFALGSLIYDAGRRVAGFDQGDLEQEVKELRQAVGQLENEALRLRAVSHANDSKLKIEQSAQRQLASQVKLLEAENNRLKEDLAFFDSLAPTGDRLAIQRFTVQPDALPGEYRYRLLVMLGAGRKERPFQGSVQLVVHVQSEGRDDMIVIPDPGAPENKALTLNFKHFQRVEGSFRVPGQAKVQSVQVRVLERGASQARAVQSWHLS